MTIWKYLVILDRSLTRKPPALKHGSLMLEEFSHGSKDSCASEELYLRLREHGAVNQGSQDLVGDLQRQV